jgi:hypothetical protein
MVKSISSVTMLNVSKISKLSRYVTVAIDIYML